MKSAKKVASSAKKKVKKVKRVVHSGRAVIRATFNNTKITVTDLDGNVLAWDSAGAQGFKGSKKSTPFAAQQAAEKAIEQAIALYGIKELEVYIKGPGPGRESAARQLATKCKVKLLVDATPVPHNGCRPEKERRV